MLKTLRASYTKYIYVLESNIFLHSCLRSGRAPIQTPNFIRAGQVMQCHALPCVGAWAHMVVPKMISCDYSFFFCMFVWPVCLTLPHGFARVVHPQKPQISFGSCTHGNHKFRSRGSGCVMCGCLCKCVRVGQVTLFEGTQGTRTRIKNAKLLPAVGFVHIHAAYLLDSPLCLHFSHLSEPM